MVLWLYQPQMVLRLHYTRLRWCYGTVASGGALAVVALSGVMTMLVVLWCYSYISYD